jgi:hypothetical protein
MGSKDPEAIGVLALLMDLHTAVQVPNTEGLVLGI